MLEGLDDIPWGSLQTMFGTANDAPVWFRDLLSPIRDIREMAMRDLSEKLWHQGTVAEATLRAIPFLFELLECDDVKVKTKIAILLMLIADAYTGWPSNDLPNQCRKAIEGKLDVLLPYFRHKEPGVRGMLLNAVVRFPEKKNGLIPLLQLAIEREGDSGVRSAIETGIEQLRSGTPRTIRSLY